MNRPLILLSNDDGYSAAGITILAETLAEVADVWMVAPDGERSATSHSLSLHTPLRVKDVGHQRFSVDGTPADCVYLALNELLPRAPALVVSGINHGANLGTDVLYSGTVGAAMEGALVGIPAVAVSLCLSDDHRERSDATDHFRAAANFTTTLLMRLLATPLEPGILLNVNCPANGTGFAGTRVCRLGYTNWSGSVESRTDPRGRPYYWIGGERNRTENEGDSDAAAVAKGFVAITPIHYDLTFEGAFAQVEELSLEVTGACVS